MAAPINTYNSSTNLNLGQVPIGLDPELYQELLDIHNALEILLTSSDEGSTDTQEFIDKFRNFSTPAITGDYTILVTDGLVRVDANAGAIIITMHPVAIGLGYQYSIKRIDTVTTNKVTLIGVGAELIDNRANGINLSSKSSYTLKAHATGWDII